MKKINFLMLIFFISICNQISAQKITKESCTTLTVNDKYIQQVIIYGDKDFNYFTEFEKGKGKNGVTSIAKFSKDMKFINRILLSDIINKNKDLVFDEITILNGNFVIVFIESINKDDLKVSLVIVNEDLKIVKPLTEVFTTNNEYSRYNSIYQSTDSTNLLFVFGRSESNTYSNLDIRKKIIVLDKSGNISFDKIVLFKDFKEFENKVVDVLFDNKNIYFELAVGFGTPTNYITSSGSSRSLGAYTYGIAKKTDKMKYNFCVFKYDMQNEVNMFLLKDKGLEDNYVISSKLSFRNGILYYAGTYTVEKRQNDFILLNYDGHFLIKFDCNTGQIQSSVFQLDYEKGCKGSVSDIFFKIDGGVYVVVEDNNSKAFSYSSNLAVYNYNSSGNLIWNKLIVKEHQGGNAWKNYEFLRSVCFVKNNDLFILMNESKKNAILPIGTPMEEIKSFDKNSCCISYVFNDNSQKKNIVYNIDETKCPFYVGSNSFNSIYLTDRKNDIFINFNQNKIFSIGGVDDERKISTLKIE